MAQKICCGGFELGEGLELDGRTLKASGGSGLPDPSTLPNGTAMVAVDGEWKMQEGYGYTEEGSITTITWDGDTEGRDVLTLSSLSISVNCYKVAEKESEYPENASAEIVYGGKTYSFDVELTEYTGAYAYNLEDQTLVIIASAGDINVDEFTGNVPSDGVYFVGMDAKFTSSLTYGIPTTVHKIDSKYLPQSGGVMVVNIAHDGDDGWTADKSVQEICEAYFNCTTIMAKTEDEFGKFVITAVGAYKEEGEGWCVVFGGKSGLFGGWLVGAQDTDGDTWDFVIT